MVTVSSRKLTRTNDVRGVIICAPGIAAYITARGMIEGLE